MAFPARKIEMETPMEERVARLEVKVDHIQADITEMKAEMKAEIGRLDKKIEAVKDSVNALRVEMKESLAALRNEMSEAINQLKVGRWIDRVWWLIIAAALLGVMARGFKWI
jgi:ABC-type phosphate transport system auxiliary subunit